MFDISSNDIISMPRGDTFTMPIIINIGDDLYFEHYELKDEDLLYFGLCEPNQPFEQAILRKVFNKDSEKDENGDTLLHFFPQDTVNLIPGKYYYTIKLRRDEDDVEKVDTIVNKKLFWIWG